MKKMVAEQALDPFFASLLPRVLKFVRNVVSFAEQYFILRLSKKLCVAARTMILDIEGHQRFECVD